MSNRHCPKELAKKLGGEVNTTEQGWDCSTLPVAPSGSLHMGPQCPPGCLTPSTDLYCFCTGGQKTLGPRIAREVACSRKRRRRGREAEQM